MDGLLIQTKARSRLRLRKFNILAGKMKTQRKVNLDLIRAISHKENFRSNKL
jgi:hypothetical protein